MVLQLIILILFFCSALLLFNEFTPWVTKLVGSWQKKRTEKMLPGLDQIWVEVPFKKLILMNILFPLILFGVGIFIAKNMLGGVIGFAIGLILPSLFIRYLERNRKKKFANQLVDALMMLSGALKAGLSLLQAMEVLVEEMPTPISQEFGLVIRENRVGANLEESLIRLNKRMQIEELELMINSILVARTTGGDLTKVFSRLATTIRDTHKLKEHIKTLTLQGRIQGIVMSVLPIFFAWWVLTFNKQHFDIMFQSQTGRMLLFLAIILQVVGMYLIHRFSAIKF